MTDARRTPQDHPPGSARSIHLFIAAHTNVGKTALLRTLLGEDAGQVEDAPDVTQATTPHTLASAPDGSSLLLWDSPGFGDSFRLARRLRLRQRWLAWLRREAWDRFFNPALWRDQRLVLDLRQRADVVLYPVNVLERPIDAVYVAPELDALAWVGKPVLVILNQGGVLRQGGDAEARIAEWQQALSTRAIVRSVVDLDAFNRCWVQELRLFEAIGQFLPEGLQAVYRPLAATLASAHLARFDASAVLLAELLVQISSDRIEQDSTWISGLADAAGRVRDLLPWGRSEAQRPTDQAMEDLAGRLAQRTRDLADRLVALHRLNGAAADEALEVAARELRVEAPASASATSLLGGVASGVLTGLAADLMAGGLTLGGGALIGGVLGAVGGAALAKGYNVLRSRDKRVVRWSADAVLAALGRSVLLYLSVAHFGRGQGSWHKTRAPEAWATAVEAVMQAQRSRLDGLCAQRDGAAGHDAALRESALALVRDILAQVLTRLDPEAQPVLASLPGWVAQPAAPGGPSQPAMR